MKKYILTYSVYADNETEAYDRVDSAILHGGSNIFGIHEEQLTSQEYELYKFEELTRQDNEKV